MSVKIKILKDGEVDARLQRDGYVVIPFLNVEEVESLLEYYEATHPKVNEGLFVSMVQDDDNFRKDTVAVLSKVFARPIEQYFNGCSALGGTFIAKAPGQEGVLYPHQDSTMLDENIYRSCNIWVPLVDTGEENGGMSVLRGSQDMLKTYRGYEIPSAFSDVAPTVWPYMEHLKIKAGEALIYYHTLLHGSVPNHSDKTRIAVVFALIPENAQLRYYSRKGDKVEFFECDRRFFLEHNPARGPVGLKSLGCVDYNFPSVNREQFEQLYSTISNGF
jgi:hypothetical protein